MDIVYVIDLIGENILISEYDVEDAHFHARVPPCITFFIFGLFVSL